MKETLERWKEMRSEFLFFANQRWGSLNNADASFKKAFKQLCNEVIRLEKNYKKSIDK